MLSASFQYWVMVVNSGYWLTFRVTETTATVLLAQNDQNAGNTAKLLPHRNKDIMSNLSGNF